MPRVSVIMSVYNGSKFLDQSIESILKQTFPDFEFLIVDDCSTDSSLKIIAKYAKQDSRIRIIKNETNIGLTKSLNRAILESKGEYIARIDADDFSYPERFKKQVKFLDSNLKCGLVGAWAEIIDDNDKVMRAIKYPTLSVDLKRDLIKYNPFFHSSIMIRRSTLDQVGLYNEEFRYAQDYELYFRIASKYGLENIPNVLIKYRESSSSITGKKNKKQIGFVIKAKLNAIKQGWHPRWCYIFLIRNYVSWLLPAKVKRLFK